VVARGVLLALGALAETLLVSGCSAPVRPTSLGWPRPPSGVLSVQLQETPSAASTGGVVVGRCVRPLGGGSCVVPRLYEFDLYVDSSISGDDDTVDVAAVRAVHRLGGYAICYVDAGTWEDWRPDAGSFPRAVLGRPDAGWPGERWLDVAERTVLLPIMARRARLCARAGFDAIDWDNVDGDDQATGFHITAADQLAYDRALARIAHRLHLAVALRNDFAQAGALVGSFDFAVDEQCVADDECQQLAPFVRAGKPVFDLEYPPPPHGLCAASRAAGIEAEAAGLALRFSPLRPCPLAR
jgi:hypothetical protein